MSIECGPASRGGDEDGEATTPPDAAAAVPPGWRLLAGRVPEGGSTAEAGRLEAVLANAEVGVALLGAVPLAGAVDEVKRALDASGFREVFGGHPPIVQRAVPPPGLPLGEVLDSAFSLEPPLALTPSGGADWVQAVRDAIATTRAVSTMPAGGGARPSVPESEEAAQPSAPASAGGAGARRPFRDRMPALVGCLALAALGGVALALHTARPPEPAASRPPNAGQVIASTSDDAFVPGPERSAADGVSRPAPDGGRVEAPGRAVPAAGVAAAPDAIEDAGPTDDSTAAGHAEGAPEGEPGAVVPPSPAASAISSGGDAREPEAPPGPGEANRETASANEPPPAVEAGTPAPTPHDGAAPAAGGVVEAAESGASAPPHAPPAPAQEASAAHAEGGSPVSGDRDALHDQAARDGAAPADTGRADGSPGERGADAPRQDALPRPAPPDADVARRPEPPSAPAAAPPAPPPAETAPDRAAQAPVARPAETGQSAAAPAAAARPAATAALSPDMLGLLLRRGDAARAQGDLSAARLLYGRAAEAGNAAAALAMGKTFDPDFLASQRAAGLQPQPAVAAAWYRRAAALGDPDAPALLRKLEPRAGAADGGQAR